MAASRRGENTDPPRDAVRPGQRREQRLGVEVWSGSTGERGECLRSARAGSPVPPQARGRPGGGLEEVCAGRCVRFVGVRAAGDPFEPAGRRSLRRGRTRTTGGDPRSPDGIEAGRQRTPNCRGAVGISAGSRRRRGLWRKGPGHRPRWVPSGMRGGMTTLGVGERVERLWVRWRKTHGQPSAGTGVPSMRPTARSQPYDRPVVRLDDAGRRCVRPIAK